MSRPRALSETKTPHSVSLKVLRLTAPHLSQQYTLPPHTSPPQAIPPFDRRAALAFTPEASSEGSLDHVLSADDAFILSPVLTLPPAFGPAYVGETFSCTLVASDEPAVDAAKRGQETESLLVQDVKITAEMGTPSSAANETVALAVTGAAETTAQTETQTEAGAEIEPTLVQRVIRHELIEEGTHVLAVTVTYNEVRKDAAGETLGNRVRTFRKLYQFAARTLLSISTKTRRVLARSATEEPAYVLEAQLENVADASVVLEEAILKSADRVKVVSLNTWQGNAEGPCLTKGDNSQVCYVITGAESDENGDTEIGRLGIKWRNVMGERGRLSTGVLRHVSS